MKSWLIIFSLQRLQSKFPLCRRGNQVVAAWSRPTSWRSGRGRCACMAFHGSLSRVGSPPRILHKTPDFPYTWWQRTSSLEELCRSKSVSTCSVVQSCAGQQLDHALCRLSSWRHRSHYLPSRDICRRHRNWRSNRNLQSLAWRARPAWTYLC